MFELNDPVRDNAAPTVIRHCPSPLVYGELCPLINYIQIIGL